MSIEYSNLANSPIMWLACAPGVLWVVFQSVLFFRRSRKDSLRMGISDKQVGSAIRAASISSIGPCFVMITAMLTLMLYVGAPFAWLRTDFIGSVVSETTWATLTAQGMGLTLGSSDLTLDFLGAVTIVNTLCCLPWVLFAAIFSDKMERVNAVMSGGKAVLVPVVGAGAALGCYSSLVIDYTLPISPSTCAVLSSGIVMALLVAYNKKANIQWLKEWCLTISMIAGMIGGVVCAGLQ